MTRNTILSAAVIGVGLLGSASQSGTAAPARSAEAALTAAAIGKAAPSFTLTSPHGKTVSLEGARQGQKATVLMFVSVQCPVSNAYNDRMIQLAKDYSGKNVRFLGINANKGESVEAVANHAKEKHFNFPVLVDVGNVVADAYDARVTPQVYVIDDKGVLRYRGRIDDSQEPAGIKSRDLRASLDAVLAGKPVATAETRAFGCGIKRMDKEPGS